MKTIRKMLITLLSVGILFISPSRVAHGEAAFMWSSTGSMSTARYSATATLLTDGRVLVCGGDNGISVNASSEIYDPAMGMWSETASMSNARWAHTATLLADGRILVAGGINGSYLSSAEVYDPAMGTWSVTGSMSNARVSHTMTLLEDGRVLVVGGEIASVVVVASAEIYDPVAGTWSPTGSLSTTRSRHTATLLDDGRVLVTGGYRGGPTASSIVASAEVYDPAMGTWSLTGSMSTGRSFHTATMLQDGRVLVTGAYTPTGILGSAEIYDPVTGAWSLTGSTSARYGHDATLLTDGRVLVAAGHNGLSYLASAEIYDPGTGIWSPTGSMNTARGSNTATLLPDGRLLVTGGYNGFSIVASAEIFAPTPPDTKVNRPPVAVCQNVTVTSDATCSASADVNNGSSDPDGDTLTITQSPAGPYAVGTSTVTLGVDDGRGGTRTCTATVTVNAPKPVPAITGPASGSIYQANTPITFTGTFTDLASTTHTTSWEFESAMPPAITAAGTVVEPAGATPGSSSVTQSFTTPGVYLVTLTVANNCGGSGQATTIGVDQFSALVVIYHPDGGFVTGGGWINSPAGACTADPTLTGKANFGFVSKYQKGANVPTGNTEFQFKAAGLNFKSTVYEWLVVAGKKAQYKGSGTINGTGDYRFMLTAIEGQQPGGGGQDKFRIRIWNNNGGGLVYDNQMNVPDSDDPTTVLGGGSIVIHK